MAISPPSKDSSRGRFAALLRDHMEFGTRPSGKRGTGRWSVKALAREIGGVSERLVQYYRSGAVLPGDISAILDALFSDDPQHADKRASFIAAFNDARSINASAFSSQLLAYQNSSSGAKANAGRLLEIEDKPLDGHALVHGLQQKIIVRVKGATILNEEFLKKSSQLCETKKLISSIVNPRDLSKAESIVSILMAHLLIHGLRKEPWYEEDLTRFVNQCGRVIRDCLLTKAYDIGILSIDKAWYYIDADALETFYHLFAGGVADGMSRGRIKLVIFQSWRHIILSVLHASSERDQLYASILSLLMYCMIFDNGLVDACLKAYDSNP